MDVGQRRTRYLTKKMGQAREVVGWLVVHLSVSNNQPAPSLFREKKLLLISLKRIEEL